MNVKKCLYKYFIIMILSFVLSGCVRIEIKSASVFKKPIKYQGVYAYIDIPEGISKSLTANEKKFIVMSWDDGANIGLSYFGNCGGGISFTGILIPIVPWVFFNKCEENGFIVTNKGYLDIIGVSLELKYNNRVYKPYIDIQEKYVQGRKLKNDWIKFKIPNFTEFKKAKDKTLIIHKIKPDGTMWTKELPFDWKIVVETDGGL